MEPVWVSEMTRIFTSASRNFPHASSISSLSGQTPTPERYVRVPRVVYADLGRRGVDGEDYFDRMILNEARDLNSKPRLFS
jgi:hypothetical protein